MSRLGFSPRCSQSIDIPPLQSSAASEFLLSHVRQTNARKSLLPSPPQCQIQPSPVDPLNHLFGTVVVLVGFSLIKFYLRVVGRAGGEYFAASAGTKVLCDCPSYRNFEDSQLVARRSPSIEGSVHVSKTEREAC